MSLKFDPTRSDVSTYHIGTAVRLRKDVASIGGRHDKVWDNGNSLDLGGPVKLPVVTNAQRGLWGLVTRINATSRRRQDLTQWNLFPGDVLRLEFIQISSHKTSKQ